MKKLLLVLVFLVGLVLVLGLAAVWFGDSLATGAVERAATNALGVPTELGEMRLGVFDGRVDLADLRIDNPDGFDQEHLLTLGSAGLAVAPWSLLSDTVRVPEIRLSGLRLHLQQAGVRSNIQSILEAMGSDESAPAGGDGGVGFVIEQLRIEDVEVEVLFALAAEEPSRAVVPLAPIDLKNIGSDRPVSLDKVVGIVVQTVIATALANGGDAIPAPLRAVLQAGMQPLESLEALGVKFAGDLAGTAAQQLEKAAAEAARKLHEQLGGRK